MQYNEKEQNLLLEFGKKVHILALITLNICSVIHVNVSVGMLQELYWYQWRKRLWIWLILALIERFSVKLVIETIVTIIIHSFILI